jgi:Zn-dependent alcohol dehydrogenase
VARLRQCWRVAPLAGLALGWQHQMENLLVSGRLELEDIVTHELPLERFAEAFKLMQSGEGIKIVLNING